MSVKLQLMMAKSRTIIVQLGGMHQGITAVKIDSRSPNITGAINIVFLQSVKIHGRFKACYSTVFFMWGPGYGNE